MSERMNAGVFVSEGKLEVQARPLPGLSRPDEVVLELEGCGLCGTDLHILATPPGHPATPGVVLGHEFLGKIVETGSEVDMFPKGERVAVDPNLKCGLCRLCRQGLENHCERWTTLGIFRDGGFARYAVVPQRALHPISEAVPFEDAVWTEILSCVSASTDRIGIQPGQTAAVIGAGPVGVLHGLLFQAAGARVLLSDVADARLELAQRVGLKHTVNVARTPLAEAVAERSDGLGADVVVDAVGNQFPACLEAVARRGTISLFGMNERAQPPLPQNEITRNELTVFGSYVGQRAFPRAIQLLERRAIRPSALNTHHLPVSQLPQGIEAARSGEAMKVVITPD